MKTKIIILGIITVLLIILFAENLSVINLSIKLNFGVDIPKEDEKIFSLSEEGRDGNSYTVIKYNDDNKIKKIKTLDWKELIKYENSEENNDIIETEKYLENFDERLSKFLERNNVQKNYYPTISEDTVYFKKDFKEKNDYLLMLYDKKTSIIYIYEYHI